MADEAIEPESSTQNPLVTVTFQRDPNRKQKYLEAEPKALGITQILLSVHQIASQSILPSTAYYPTNDVPYYVTLVVVMIAGSVAIAAKNLHLPTASFGMQLLSIGASFFNMIWILVDLDGYSASHSWRYAKTNTSEQTCKDIEHVEKLVFGQKMIIQVALFAISVTLAIYACKVINCCGPAGKMPVITVQTPPPAESNPEPDPLQ